MFTGLIQHVGKVVQVAPSAAGRRLLIDAGGWPSAAQQGESISINGCCLTLSGVEQGRLAFDAVPQTLSTTTLSGWQSGQRVNLERSCTPNTLLGGHIVQGHVDGVGEVLAVREEEGRRVRFALPEPLAEFLVPKGSIAVDGVSLTLAATDPRAGWFEVALIPETLERTTLGMLREGDRVNLEADVLARTIVHWLREFGGPVARRTGTGQTEPLIGD